jgi:hypothetical protein
MRAGAERGTICSEELSESRIECVGAGATLTSPLRTLLTIAALPTANGQSVIIPDEEEPAFSAAAPVPGLVAGSDFD